MSSKLLGEPLGETHFKLFLLQEMHKSAKRTEITWKNVCDKFHVCLRFNFCDLSL